MFAKAAASTFAPGAKGAVYLDSHDAKLIQFKTAMYKLTEISRVISILEKSLNRNNTTTRYIIPLANYILALCYGPAFNVHPSIARRIKLLMEFKVEDFNDVRIPLNSSPVELLTTFPEVDSNFDTYRGKIYNLELQIRTLSALQKVTKNALLMYNRKYKECCMERDASRPTDISGRSVSFDEDSVRDLIQPTEVSLSLDLAVLIKDIDVDASESSFSKLNLQVLTKIRDHLNEKAIGSLRSYHTSLFRFTRATSMSQAKIIMSLPYWQYTMHRIYAMALRTVYLLQMIKAATRQIFIPSKKYFNDSRTQFQAKNSYEYQLLLKDLEALSSGDEEEGFETRIKTLGSFCKQGSLYPVQPKNISYAFHDHVTLLVQTLRTRMLLLDNWVDNWTYLRDNSSTEAFRDKADEEFDKLLSEKFVTDKSTYLESRKAEALEKQTITKNATVMANRSPIKTVFRSNSARKARRPSVSSETSSGTTSPAVMSRTPSTDERRQVSFPKMKSSMNNTTSYLSPQNSRRGSITGLKASPSEISSSSMKSVIVNRGRKRSASLQTSGGPPGEASHERAHSLQAAATLNQRMIQNAYHHLSPKLTEKYDTVREERGGSSNSNKKYAAVASTHAMSSESPSPLMRNSDSRISADELRISNLTLGDSETDVEHLEKDSGSSTNLSNSETNATSDNGEDGELSTVITVQVKKVRFTGVPPMSDKEDPKPKRRGWFKKPAVLHYPPPPSQFSSPRYRLRQEGLAFRHNGGPEELEAGARKPFSFAHLDQQAGHRLSSKIRERVIR
ncbi:LAMI_0F06194g1_1 [Lachancea mirantina]|uniref:LAMI_0F06194g1_1 n=1 Tax=Lachancea mirantina TaxID=1230905 RepID=A0A1G4JYR6_9SACH|nr:LAMI_0F06194g1_1 [Lachancea mirantina]